MRAEGTQGGDVREIEETWGVKLADKHQRERGKKRRWKIYDHNKR